MPDARGNRPFSGSGRQERDAPFTGVVLAGGAGSRLGRNKSLMRLTRKDGELDILARTVTMLENVCGRAVVAGRNIPGYECIDDALPGKGPMGGIASALQHSPGPCLVLSCDLPFMEAAILDRLVFAHRNRPRGALCTSYRNLDSGRIEALVAVYERDTLPLFLNCLSRDLLKISLTVPLRQQHFVPYAAGEAHCFFNINYPADLEAAERIFSATGEQNRPG